MIESPYYSITRLCEEKRERARSTEAPDPDCTQIRYAGARAAAVKTFENKKQHLLTYVRP